MATLPDTVTVPFVGAVLIAIVLATPVIALVKSMALLPLKGTVTVRATTVGAPGVATTKVTVAGADVPPEPVAVKAKLSVPKKFAFGVYVATVPLMITVPLRAGVVMRNELTPEPVARKDKSAWPMPPKGTCTVVPAVVGGGTRPTVMVNVPVPVPDALVAPIVTELVPAAVGVPLIKPVVVLMLRPAGRPVAE